MVRRFHLSTAVIAMLIASVILGAIIAAWPLVHNLVTYGRFFPKIIVEKLNNPVEVSGWDDDGLVTDNGQHIPIPNIRKLPKTSLELSMVVAKGIEKSDGRIIGLVRVWHWCGNDSVGEHIVRVDIGHILEYLSIGEFETPINPPHWPISAGQFDTHGWRVGDYYRFKDWADGTE